MMPLFESMVTDIVLARNRVLVIMDWLKAKFFGRDVSRE